MGKFTHHPHVEFRTENGKTISVGAIDPAKIEGSEIISKLIQRVPDGLKIPIHSIFVKNEGFQEGQEEFVICRWAEILPDELYSLSWTPFVKVAIGLKCQMDLSRLSAWDFKVNPERERYCYVELFWLWESKDNADALQKVIPYFDEASEIRFKVYEKLRSLEERILDSSFEQIFFCSPILTFDSNSGVRIQTHLLENFLMSRDLLAIEIKKLSNFLTFLQFQAKKVSFHLANPVGERNKISIWQRGDSFLLEIELGNPKTIKETLLYHLRKIKAVPS